MVFGGYLFISLLTLCYALTRYAHRIISEKKKKPLHVNIVNLSIQYIAIPILLFLGYGRGLSTLNVSSHFV